MGKRGDAELALMKDFFFLNFSRPVHDATRRKKIISPNANYYEEMLLFEENGLG